MEEKENSDLRIYSQFCEVYRLCSDDFLKREFQRLPNGNNIVELTQYDALLTIIELRELQDD